MIEIKITVTREHIEVARYCGYDKSKYPYQKSQGQIATNISNNCAIAVAVQNIFPLCDISSTINNSSRLEEDIDNEGWSIRCNTDEVRKFLAAFDRFTPEQREDILPGFEFTIVIREKTLKVILEQNGINMKQFEDQLTRTGHLTLI